MAVLYESPDSGTFFEVEKAYNTLSNNQVKLAIGIKTFYDTITEIINKDEQNFHIRITAYAKILDAEAVILFHDFELNFTYFIGRIKEPLKTTTYQEWLELESTYLGRMDSLIAFAWKCHYFLGVSNIVSAKIQWNYKSIYHRYY